MFMQQQKLLSRMSTICRIWQSRQSRYSLRLICQRSQHAQQQFHRFISKNTSIAHSGQYMKPNGSQFQQTILGSYLCISSGKNVAPTFLQTFDQKHFYTTSNEMNELTFDQLVGETLEHLCDFFEELGDSHQNCSSEYDVTFGDGVLTVKFGADHGTYVINKQTPNKQIWLSSPTSGPKRYDFMDDRWIYKHDGIALHDLLTEEVSRILDSNIDFTKAEIVER